MCALGNVFRYKRPEGRHMKNSWASLDVRCNAEPSCLALLNISALC